MHTRNLNLCICISCGSVQEAVFGKMQQMMNTYLSSRNKPVEVVGAGKECRSNQKTSICWIGIGFLLNNYCHF